MNNFEFNMGTDILFGKDQIDKLPNYLKKYGNNILITYGGGSIKKIGLYDKVKSLLKDFTVFEYGGIESNPKIDSVYEGKEICRENNIDTILAIGGGSVIDCAKAIATATYYDGDVWELYTTSSPIEKALPVFSVLTLAAAGSEINSGSVISNPKTNEKRVYKSEHLRPKVAILDPQYTFTVPKSQTSAGAIDIMSHVLEEYFTADIGYLSGGICESLLKTVIKYAPIALKYPYDYEARAQIMWARSLADNGLMSLGNIIPASSCHGIEHELSAYYDITHGVGLAIVTPNWMRYVLSDNTIDRFVAYGVNVWDINRNLPKIEIADLAINMTKDFFRSLGVPLTLTEMGIDGRNFDLMAEHAVIAGRLEYGYVPLTREDVKSILNMCL